MKQRRPFAVYVVSSCFGRERGVSAMKIPRGLLVLVYRSDAWRLEEVIYEDANNVWTNEVSYDTGFDPIQYDRLEFEESLMDGSMRILPRRRPKYLIGGKVPS